MTGALGDYVGVVLSAYGAMINTLGDYVGVVLSAYGAGLGLIGILVAVSLWQHRRARAALGRIEQGRDG